MWTAHSEKIAERPGLRYVIEANASPVSYAQVLRLWEGNHDFRSMFLALLAESPFAAFRWETPPVTTATVERPFECVVLDSPGLAALPDPYAFAEHFPEVTCGNAVVSFPNLARNAILIAPCPDTSTPFGAYGHLAAFVRHAPEPQQHALWQRVAEALEQRLGAGPVWLSTAGAGVSLLHVRLDDRPKYYTHAPYQQYP